jgi:PKD repeat protein
MVDSNRIPGEHLAEEDRKPRRTATRLGSVALTTMMALALVGPLSLPGSALALDCDEWRLVNPLPSERHLNDVAFGEGRYVAVGDGGTMLSASSHVVWESEASPTPNDLRSVVATGSGFLAVGEQGTVVRSTPDGGWSLVAAPTARDLVDIAWDGGSTLVAVGGAGTIVRSGDGGQSWSVSPSGVEGDIRAVAWTGDGFLAAGQGGTAVVSADGSVWAPLDLETQEDIIAIASNRSTTVVVTADGTVLTSIDGGGWKRRPIDSDIRDIAWIGDRFVTAGRLYFSLDGHDWRYSQVHGSGLAARAVGPAWYDSRAIPVAVAVGDGGTIGFSRDGAEHWQLANSATGLELYGLAVKDQIVVAVGGNPSETEAVMLVSGDAMSWDVTFEIGLETFYDVATDGVVFIAAGVVNELLGGPVLRKSGDGRQWGGAIESITGDGWSWAYTAVVWDGVRWVVGGTNATVLVSSDGAAWHRLWIEENFDISGIASNQSVIVGVGERGQVIVSSDGETLQLVDVPSGEVLRDADWGADRFVAVGDAGSVLTSPDGLAWSVEDSRTTADLVKVRWSGERFLAAGTGGTVVTSDDGVEWHLVDVGTGSNLLDVVTTDSSAVVSGEDGLLKVAICDGIGDDLRPRFAWRPVVPEAGWEIGFLDLSVGQPETWQWDFGDGTLAATANPVHSFDSEGTYLVRVDVARGNQSATAIKDVTVLRACEPTATPVLSAPQSAASGEPYTVSWAPVFDPAEFGSLKISESRTGDFQEAIVIGWGDELTTATYAHHWGDGAVFHYRAQSVNECRGGAYRSVESNTVQVFIEPTLDDLGNHAWVIPAVASGVGLRGTRWTSGVVVHNPHDADVPVYLVFLGRGDSSAATIGQRFVVGPQRSLQLDDALAEFGEDLAGALVVISDRALHVGARAFNDATSGTFGQFMTGTPVARSIAPGTSERILQLREDERFRTNLALANPGTESSSASVVVRASDGAVLGQTVLEVPATSSVFVDRILSDHSAEPVSGASAEVSVAPSSSSGIVAMASVVDNRTGDPTTQPVQSGASRLRNVDLPRSDLERSESTLGLAFGAGRWVAARRDGIATSIDGIDWEFVYRPPGRYTWMTDVAFNGEQFLALGEDDVVVVSDDGLEWTNVGFSDGTLLSATWDGSQWFAVGETVDYSAIRFMATSIDGLTWSVTQTPELDVAEVHWSGGQYIGVTGSGVATSADGVTWNFVDLGEQYQFARCSEDAGCVAIARRTIARSDDGRTWQTETFEREFHTLTRAMGYWVVGAGSLRWFEDSFYLVSDDGRTWSTVDRHRSGAPIQSMATAGNQIMTVDFHGWVSLLIFDDGDLTLPAVAHVQGARDSTWRSDVVLHNPGETSMECTLSFFERGPDPAATVTRQVMVPPNGSALLPDVVGDLFAREGVGALRIASVPAGVLASSRTYDDAVDGTYGQSVPALGASDAVHAFESGRLMSLAHDPDRRSGVRTNIGLVSDCAEPMQVVVDLYRGERDPVTSFTTDLAAFGVTQLNDVLRGVVDEVVNDGFAIVSTPTVGCAFFAYASVVDNRSNDPMLVPAMPWHDEAGWLPAPEWPD